MKKVLAFLLALVLALSFPGCGRSNGQTPTGYTENYKVAIVQQLDHSSLDEIRLAIHDRLEALRTENGVGVVIRDFNGQNDSSMLSQIGSQVVAEGYDLVIPIGTLAAQAMVTATDGTGIPVVYAAISDPESAGLTGFANVTGTCDALDTDFILDMMFLADPRIKTVGLLYSNSEPNSQKPIAQAKARLDSMGIAYVEATGNTADEILTASASLVGRVDAVFTPTDNAVMASEGAVAQILTEAGIPHYAGADSFVSAGAFATCGINYTQLGSATGDMAFAILRGGAVGDYQTLSGGVVTVNGETAKALGLDPMVFSQMENVAVLETVAAAE